MLPVKFGLIWLKLVSEEKIFYSSQSETRIALGGHICWPPRAILVSDWLLLNKSSPLKLLGQMEPNLAISIYVSPL
jgi:hypothetical protein